jgi:hypothetical protein
MDDWFSPRSARTRDGFPKDEVALGPTPILPSMRIVRKAMAMVPPREPVRIDWQDGAMRKQLTPLWQGPAPMIARSIAVNGRLGHSWLPDGNGSASPAEDVVIQSHRSGIGLDVLAASACEASRLTLEYLTAKSTAERRDLGFSEAAFDRLSRSAEWMRDVAAEHGIDPARHDPWLTVLCLHLGCGTHLSNNSSASIIHRMAQAHKEGVTLLHVAAASLVAWTTKDVRNLDRGLKGR